MSNIFIRIKESIVADVHQLLDEKEEKNPIASLNQYVRQAEVQKQKVKKALERHYRLKEEFTSEYHDAADRAKKRLKQAEIAEAAGEDELYQFASREYNEYNERAKRMEQARQDAVEQIDQLERKYKEMEHKLKDMYLKRMELMGRENIAKAHNEMNQVLQQSIDKPYSRFTELERSIKKMEDRINKAYYESTFDEKIARIEETLKQKATQKNS